MTNYIKRKTGEVLYDVVAKSYPNRLGYSFGGSIEYKGYDCYGNPVSVPSGKFRQYIKAYSVGEIRDEGYGARIYTTLDVKQLSKNLVLVRQRIDYKDGTTVEREYEEEGRILPLEPKISRDFYLKEAMLNKWVALSSLGYTVDVTKKGNRQYRMVATLAD